MVDSAQRLLGPGLAARVIGFTSEDLTLRAAVPPRQKPIDGDDYWRLMKCDIVLRNASGD
ncbi:UNVERIFIED_ORG: hypothetical protein ABIC43_006760 [Variovorax guangxiensis]